MVARRERLQYPGSPSEQPPPAYSPPAQAPGSPAPGVYTAPTGQVPERLGGPYYSPGLVILLSIVTLGIWTFLWVYRTSEDLKRYNGDGLGRRARRRRSTSCSASC